MRLALGPYRYDVATRALVMGIAGPLEELAARGADLVELDAVDRPAAAPGIPICMAASDEAAVGRALSQGADLLHMPHPTPGSLRLCAAAGAAVLIPAGAAGDAAAAGLPHECIVVDSLLVDVSAHDCPLAAAAVGVIRGARIVRTADVRGARRICDVLAAVLEAR